MTTSEEKQDILERLYVLWERHPQLRLGQLIGNVYHSMDSGGVRQYYATDRIFIENLENHYD